MAIRNHPEINHLPTLYKKSNTGALLEWRIRVEGTTIVTTHGQHGGKMQSSPDQIKSGKNAGKKNATDPAEQAKKEATARWTKQKKAGYVESIGDARAGVTDGLIEGGVIPMLAKVKEDNESKITYPLAVQPKLDGHRCIAMIDKAGKVTLWTRTRKPIRSVPHIVSSLERIALRTKLRGVTLDGELYNHDLREDFEKLTSAVRKQGDTAAAASLTANIQYHVYDMVAPMCFRSRFGLLAEIILLGGKEVELVNTKYANTHDEAQMYFTLYQKLGYEGSMIRLLGMPYENKRHHQLLKVKTFTDEEFEIIDVVEGRGKLAGHGIFVCKTGNPRGFKGKQFNVKMAEENEKLKKYWENKMEYVGQQLTVKFQGKTKDGVPRFPVGLRIREDL